MKHFLRFASVLAFAVGLSACAQFQQEVSSIKAAITSIGTSSVDYRYALAAVEGFNTIEAAGTTYISLPRCTAKSGPVCRDAGATRQIVAAFRSGRIARDAVLNFVAQNPCDKATGQCPLVPKSIYDTLQGTVATLQSVYATYKVGTGG